MSARLVTMLILASSSLVPAAADGHVSLNVNVGAPPPPPIVLPAPPPLVVVPGVPVVSYVPALQLDLFLYGRRWYYPNGGYWYVGPTYRGPWTPVLIERLPPPILAVPVRYYKVPPGHRKRFGVGGPPDHAKGRWKGHD